MTNKNQQSNRDTLDDETLEEFGDDAVIGRAFRYSLICFCILGVIILATIFWLKRPEEIVAVNPTVVSELNERNIEVKIPKVGFTDITAAAGLEFVHENGAYGDKLLPETMGSGCAFFDYDNDGDPDILFVNSTRWPWDDRKGETSSTIHLYRNDGNNQFADVTEATGLDISLYGTGVAVGDYDNDGHRDLFLSAVGKNRLFRNLGGHFVDVTAEANVGGEAKMWSTSCGFFDYDNDGLLDLFVCNYVRWSKKIDLEQGFRLTGIGRAYGPPNSFEGTHSYLYHNEGGGKFVDVSKKMGIEVSNHLTGVPVAKALGIAPIDLDGDGWMDLVVANDTVRNFLFQNRGGVIFEEVGELSGVAFDSNGSASGAMGIDTVSFPNENGFFTSIAIGNFANEMSSLYVATDAPLQFFDAAIATGLGPATRSSLTFGLAFFDYDLDGRLDLLAANGHLEEEINKVQESQHYEQPPQLFWNGGSFDQPEYFLVPPEMLSDGFVEPMVGRGAAYADIDGDGDLDILFTSCGGRPRLLRNDLLTGKEDPHWIRFELTGTSSSRDAIGAWVELSLDDCVMRQQVMPTRSYLSQVEQTITFGLGNHGQVIKAEIHWPSGISQVIEINELDRVYKIVEASPQ